MRQHISKTLLQTFILFISLIFATLIYAVDGETAYNSNCAACHQPTGAGLPPAFPALKGSKIVTADDPTEQIKIVLNGKAGTAMLPFNGQSDAVLSAIITYTRTSWGNVASEVTPDQVKELRE